MFKDRVRDITKDLCESAQCNLEVLVSTTSKFEVNRDNKPSHTHLAITVCKFITAIGLSKILFSHARS